MSKRRAPNPAADGDDESPAKRPSPDVTTDDVSMADSQPPEGLGQGEREMSNLERELLGEDDSDDDQDMLDGGEAAEAAALAMETKEAGIISQIHVENFMNHRKLTVNLCKNVNFIHGQNGSGKSAILAALQICLGARANVTHRGSSLESLVRHGHEGYALVQVTLLNSGNDAFRPEEFGDKITVERRIGHGNSGYRLLSVTGRCVSTNKRDLESMLDLLNIQVENPVCIMDQENSKEFIKGNPGDQYRFFARATDLDRALTAIRDAKEDVSNMKDTHHTQAKRIEVYAKAAEDAQNKVEFLQSIYKIDDVITKLKCLLFWCEVESREVVKQKHEEALQKRISKKAKTEKALQDMIAQREALQSPSDAEAELARLAESVNLVKAKIDDTNKKIATAKRPFAEAQKKIRSLENEVKSAARDKKDVEKKIREANAERLKNAGDVERKKQEEIDRLQQQFATIDEEINSLKEETSAKSNAIHHLSAQKSEAQAEARAIQQSLREIQSNIKRLGQASSTPASQFGEQVPQVLKEIQKNKNKFDAMPVGPIGMHINLRDGCKEWGAAVSACVGSIVRNFVVSSQRDRQLLQDIIRRCKADHPITIMRFTNRYDVSQQRPANMKTIESIIEVDNDIAFNALVETTRMEQCALFPTYQDAERACITGRGSSLNLVHNVSRAYARDGSYSSVRNGNKFNVPNTTRGHRFGTNISDQLADYQRELGDTQGRFQEANGRLTQANQLCAAGEKDYRKLVDQQKKLRSKAQTLHSQIDHLKQELQAIEEAESIDTTEWEQEVNEINEQVADFKQKITEHKQAAEEARAVVQNLESEKAQNEKATTDIRKQMRDCEKQLQNSLNEQSEADARVAQAQRKAEELNGMIAGLEQEVQKVTEKYNEAVEMAETYTRQELGESARMPMATKGATREQIEAKIKQKAERRDKELKKLKPAERDLDAAQLNAARAHQVYTEKMGELEKVKRNIDYLESDITRRLKKWKNFRRTISSITGNAFDQTLQRKGQTGTINLDHRDKTLNIVVQKDSRDTQSQIENVKLLSGGERSYATLSLLLALGHSLECPFRVMDEFDVFMDQVSRKVALDLLIEQGRFYKNRQLILITPQDLSTVTQAPDVKIFKLPNPKRMVSGQTTLNFHAS